MTLRILHLSDTHLSAGGALHYGRTDTVAALRAVLARASSLESLDLIACSGDLSDDGSVDSYELLRAQIEPFAAERGAVVVYAMGNHDVREGFRAGLLGENADGPIHSVRTVGEARIITLDTSVPRAGYGMLGAEQLHWLRSELATPVAAGTVIVMHHPPVPAETTLLGALELHDAAEFLEAIRDTDVRVVLAGHYHSAIVDSVAGVTVAIAPGVTNQANIFTAPGTESAVAGSGGSIVRVENDGRVRVLPFMVALPGDGEQIFHYDADAVAHISAVAGKPEHPPVE